MNHFNIPWPAFNQCCTSSTPNPDSEPVVLLDYEEYHQVLECFQQRNELLAALKVAKEVLDDHDYPLANKASLVVDAAIAKAEAE